MGLVKWNPTTVDRFFNDFFNTVATNATPAQRTNGTLPAVNIRETEDSYLLDVAAPGYDKADFKIEVNKGLLTISANHSNEKEEQENGFSRKEFFYSNFTRRFTLPETVNEGKIGANYEAGILKVTLPKREEAKPQPARLIDVA